MATITVATVSMNRIGHHSFAFNAVSSHKMVSLNRRRNVDLNQTIEAARRIAANAA
jgi:hypothetical protein